ncbi:MULTISPECIES: DUF1684 domain-containing protein [Arthrobacter]|uniref:DUF1684 domain-containing protein n=2 Tax=Arthrobacter TaxID=1663 RepID=A0ABU9KHM9_9MICC|nr:DUF1684 domain-containing protein [Arthrobacter sp. YJM1]MDP5226575.1 DUF1684 domain-containing protein [Arthrobacter sp. YJM1]
MVSAPVPARDPQLARWQRFRSNRDAALASPHGWLTLTSLQWLPDSPAALDGVPGLWWTDGERAFVEAAAEDGLSLASGDGVSGDGVSDGGRPAPAVGRLNARLADEESLMWVQYGGEDGRQVLVELAVRGGRYAVRTRDDGSPVFTGFSGVPVFDYRPELVVTARYEPFAEPRPVPIRTANPLVDGTHVSSGELVFTLPGADTEYRLQAEEEKLGALVITFHDASNGVSTDEWRKLETARPRPDGTVILDFNRAINYPSAFTDFGTCPAPVPGNALPVAVEAGERIPR